MTKRRKRRVLIPDGEFVHALKVIRALGRTGEWDIHVCTSNPSTVMRYSRFTSGVHRTLKFSAESRVDETAAIAHDIGAALVLPVSERAVRAFSRLHHRLPPGCMLSPVPDVDTFDLAVDKSRLATFMDEQGLPAPRTWPANALLDGSAAPDPLTWPVVCKRAQGSFGRDTTLAGSPEELQTCLSSLTDPSDYIVQEFARGCDIDVSVLCREGEILLSTVQQECVKAPAGSFEPPPAVRFCRDESVERIVGALMSALGWTGVAHVDLRKDPETGAVRILEINARFWGSLLGSVSAGVNIPHLACLEALGERLPTHTYEQNIYFTKGITGRLPDRSAAMWSWRRSNLPYVLTDPLPELVSRFTRSLRS